MHAHVGTRVGGHAVAAGSVGTRAAFIAHSCGARASEPRKRTQPMGAIGEQPIQCIIA